MLPLAAAVACLAAVDSHTGAHDTTSAAVAARAASLGILNATLSCDGVDSSGANDSTAALQKCIERAYVANLALFLPVGRYLVSDTLTVAQADGGDITPFSPVPAPVNEVPCRFRPNVLLGSTASLPARPTIVLKAGSPGYQNASAPRNVVKVTNPAAENINMNQVSNAPLSTTVCDEKGRRPHIMWMLTRYWASFSSKFCGVRQARATHIERTTYTQRTFQNRSSAGSTSKWRAATLGRSRFGSKGRRVE